MRPRVTAAACLLLVMVPSAPESKNWTLNAGGGAGRDICHLRLTATQVARLDALFERELPQRVQRHREIQDLDRHLARVIEHDNGDDSHVAHLSEQVEARAAANIRRTLMLFTMTRR